MKKKYKDIFGLSFIIFLLVALLLTGSGVYNFMVMNQTQQEEEQSKKQMLFDERKTEGSLQLLDINVIVDASETGWTRVKKGLLYRIADAFEHFPGQHHRIIFNGSCKDEADERSSQVFVDTCDKKAIDNTINSFMTYYEKNGADAPYVKMIESGLKKSDKNASLQGRKNIVILIIGGPDGGTGDHYSYNNAYKVMELLEQYDASLYCIGLDAYRPGAGIIYSKIGRLYGENEKETANDERIKKNVKLEQIEGIFDEIVRKEAFDGLLTSSEIVIPRESEDQRLSDLSIMMYAKGEASGVIQKIIQTESGTSYETLSNVNITNSGHNYQFTKEMLDDLSEPFTIRISLNSTSDNVNYTYTYNMYRKINKELDQKIMIARILCIASFSAAAVMAIVLLISRIKAVRRRKRTYAFFHQNKV